MHRLTRVLTCVALHALAACGPTSSTTAGDSSGDTTAPPPDTTTPGETTTGATDTPTTGPSPTSTTGDISTGDISGDSFIIPLDGGACVGGFAPDGKFRCSECDTFSQNCPKGEKCTVWDGDGSGTLNAHKCTPVTGDGVTGSPCTAEAPLLGVDDCALGHICTDLDADLHGTCVALCAGSPADPQCPDDRVCLIGPDAVLALCLSACDPELQDCPADETCIAASPGFACAPDLSGDEGQAIDPCAAPDRCDPGLICVDPGLVSSACDQGAFGCCTPFCSFPAGPCPEPDQVCIQWFDDRPAPPGLEDLGICAVAP